QLYYRRRPCHWYFCPKLVTAASTRFSVHQPLPLRYHRPDRPLCSASEQPFQIQQTHAFLAYEFEFQSCVLDHLPPPYAMSDSHWVWDVKYSHQTQPIPASTSRE